MEDIPHVKDTTLAQFLKYLPSIRRGKVPLDYDDAAKGLEMLISRFPQDQQSGIRDALNAANVEVKYLRAASDAKSLEGGREGRQGEMDNILARYG